MKEQIDIEALLEWAYRVQCVEHQVRRVRTRGPASLPSQAAFASFADLGTRVSTSGFQSPDVSLLKVDDAMVVHDAVLGLSDVWLEWRTGEVVIWDRHWAEKCGYEIVKTHRDGWKLDKIVQAFDEVFTPIPLQLVSRSVLMIIHARAGSRPDWQEGWRPVVGVRKKRRADRWGRRRKGDDGPSEQEMMFDRAQYVLWHGALEILASQLGGVLGRFEVLKPQAHALPWGNVASSANCYASQGFDFYSQ